MTNEDELRKRYMQSRGMSAVGGAAKGASAGTAIMPGVGSAIGAGLGGIAGWISGGPSEAERLRDEQLAELMRLHAQKHWLVRKRKVQETLERCV